ncbi:MAG: 2-C-methyl-D-erythritol 4-phosphate cytidylyltransferase, partial [Clostridia bacterium]|nr:2-C-methyl-D-erythritol 4-phosphate cytidylyltransferase [Clostridia bacterium]
MVIAAFAAGGRGTRFGADLPKQFLDLAGRPVIIRSLDAFAQSGLTDDYIVAVGAEYT